MEPGAVGIPELLQRTEGWPAGLYLAALAMQAGLGPSEVGSAFTGDDRFMGDYLRAELLSHVSADGRLASSPGPRCWTGCADRSATRSCGGTGSAAVLEGLEARNLLVVPLDRRREWYRYHHLLRELLQAELRRTGARPGSGPALPGRGLVRGERDAGGGDRARPRGGRLRPGGPPGPRAAAARLGERARRDRAALDGVAQRDVTAAEHFGAIAVHGALIYALLGQPSEAERWAAAAELASPAGILPDGSTMAGTLAYLRALLCRNGIDEMRRDAQLAWEGLSPASPYRVTMLYTEGVAYLLQGDHAEAGPILARAVNDATRAGALPLTALILAELCQVAAERGDWDEITALAERAVGIVQAGHFDDYWTSALVYAWATRAALHQGNIAQARYYLGRAARLRPLLTYALPGRVAPGPDRAGPLLYLARRPGGRGHGAPAGRRHPAAAARPRRPPGAGQRAAVAAGQDRRRRGRRVGADRGRAAAAAAAVHPPVASGRSASGCTCRRTRSSRRRTPRTGSSGSRRAARRSPAPANSGLTPSRRLAIRAPAGG